ncbi:MAG: hypothetical protein IJG40_11385 [Oscillospiraceae bacterium]|nr:hypothetical protein [Oscillospiraceae bacterium]
MKKNALGARIPSWAILIAMLAILGMILIPMLVIAHYDVPAADDFSFSCETHAAVMSGGSIFDVIAGAVEKAGKVYYTWQGSFSAIFLMAFQPAVWGLRHYALTTWIMVFSLLGSLFYFYDRLLHGVFGTSKSIAGIIAAVTSTACTQFLPSPNQSFYWYNGAVYYTFTFAVMLVLFGIMIGYMLHDGALRIVAAACLCVIIGGSNYITALFTSICGTLLITILILKKDKRFLCLLIPYTILLAAFAISIIAPGNAVRQENFSDHPGAVEAVLLSFHAAGRNALHWADLRFAAFMTFLIPILWEGAGQSNFSFRFPGAASAFSFCLFASLFTPHLFATGSDGPERLKNILYFAFLMFSVLNLFWWLGWMKGKRKRSRSTKNGISFGTLAGFSTGALLCLGCAMVFFHGTATSVAALSELRSGEAGGYFTQALERQEILENPEIKDCEFSPYTNMPYILYFTDMTEDPAAYENQDTANFYSKNSIVVR